MAAEIVFFCCFFTWLLNTWPLQILLCNSKVKLESPNIDRSEMKVAESQEKSQKI